MVRIDTTRIMSNSSVEKLNAAARYVAKTEFGINPKKEYPNRQQWKTIIKKMGLNIKIAEDPTEWLLYRVNEVGTREHRGQHLKHSREYVNIFIKPPISKNMMNQPMFNNQHFLKKYGTFWEDIEKWERPMKKD